VSSRRRIASGLRSTPYKRTYAGGRVVWVSRYYGPDGYVRYAKPSWNDRRSTFTRKGDAQRAIDEALLDTRGRGDEPQTLGDYFEGGWLHRHPRSERTNKTYSDRIGWALGVEIEGRPLHGWLFDELRRRHVHELLDHLLRVEGRSAEGARGILRAFSTMTEDAIGDDAAESNPFMGVRLRRSDPRVRKPPREIRVWSFEEMREFAAAGQAEVRARTERPRDPRNRGRYQEKPHFYTARDYEALLLTPALTGLRLGEFLGLRRCDYRDGLLNLEYSSHDGRLVESSDQKNHERTVPVPESLGRLLDQLIAEGGEDEDPLFTTPRGKRWRERNFYREVWTPAKIASGMDPTPHEFRHSYVTLLRAERIDDADLAEVAGHRIETMLSTYTHPLDRSHDAIREAIG
jgi:integrase